MSNAVIAQSGGPTSVINQSLVGCIEALRGSGAVSTIYGARHAVEGMVRGDFVDLTAIDHNHLERIADTPSAALGSSRDKPDADYCSRIFDSLAKHEIHSFFYIGGNDSSDTCRIVKEHADAAGYDLRAFHIPKTIDNDLVLNDHCPGYGSAARYVAHTFIGDNLENRALPGVKVNIIMGRHAGFLTAASALARQHEDDGPHLIYLPERNFNPEAFCEEVAECYDRLGRCQIAVSEGIHDRAGNLISAMMSELREQDAHGNIQLSGTGALGDFLADRIRSDVGKKRGRAVRVRADTFGYAQRSFPFTSPIDRDEARAVGEEAAMRALDGMESGSITITRTSTDPYRVKYGVVALADIAGKTRTMPDDFIDDDARHVTGKFLRYLKPLVGPLKPTERLL